MPGRGFTAVLAVLIVGTAFLPRAAAQSRSPASAEPVVAHPLDSAGAVLDLYDLDANPAAVAMLQGLQLLFLHSTMESGRGAPVRGATGQDLLVGGRILGPLALSGRFSHRSPAPGTRRMEESWDGGLAVGLALGRTAGLGLSWRRITGGPLDGEDDLALGAAWRPARWVSAGLTVEHLNHGARARSDLDPALRVGLAFRPLGSPVWGLTTDWEGFFDGETRWLQAGVTVEPLAGLGLGAGLTAGPRGDGPWELGGAATLSFSPLPLARVLGAVAVDGSGYGGFSAGVSVRTHSTATFVPTGRRFVSLVIEGGFPEMPRRGLFGRGSPSLLEQRVRLARLARDPRVAGIVLSIRSYTGSFAQAQELARSLDELRAHGKRVYAALEDGSNRAVYLASRADRVLLHPSVIVRTTGIHASQSFYRDTLAAVGIEAQVIAFEEYKSFGEAFERSGSSDAAREALVAVMDQVFAQFVRGLAEGRARSEDEVRGWIDRAPVAAETARSMGIVDAIATRDQIRKQMQDQEGVPVRLSPRDPWSPEEDRRWGAIPRVAVVLIQGVMVPGYSRTIPLLGLRFCGSETILTALDRALRDPRIDAVLVRVDTPGGEALVAENLNRKIREVAAAKPLAVSFGTTAASGGYYAAVAAPRIFALPSTTTGSIGVVYGKAVASGLLDKLRVRREHLLRGSHADWESLDRRLTPDELSAVRQELASLYELFLQRVAEGRSLAPDAVRTLARGRVWTGEAARGLGLVDEEGGSLEALRWLLDQVGDPRGFPPELVFLPEPSLLDALLATGGLAVGAAGEAQGLDEALDLLLSLAAPAAWMLDPIAVEPETR